MLMGRERSVCSWRVAGAAAALKITRRRRRGMLCIKLKRNWRTFGGIGY